MNTPTGAPGPRVVVVRPGRRLRLVTAAILGWLLVELLVLLAVAHWIGALPALGVVLAFLLLGSFVLRRGTPRTWATVREAAGGGPTPEHHLSRQARDAQAAGSTVVTPTGAVLGSVVGDRPNAESARRVGVDLTDDVLVLFSGLGMVFPGLLSSLIGLVLLLPPVRRAVSRRFVHRAEVKVSEHVRRATTLGRPVTPAPGDVHSGDVGFTPQPPAEPYRRELPPS